jgi:dihydrofolate reductase
MPRRPLRWPGVAGDDQTSEMPHGFRGSVFIATSLDGYIARHGGDIDWLTAGDDPGDTGYDAFMAEIDLLVMGRGTYEKVLTFGTWPFDGRPVLVLSSTLATDDDRVEVHATLDDLVHAIRARGANRVYVDGGKVIQSFLRAGLIDDITITVVPVLLGSGLPLFGKSEGDLRLTHRGTRVLGAGLVQSTYEVGRALGESDRAAP